MKPYDHLKLYLVSRTARWSYPALSNAQVRWQQAAAALGAGELPLRMAGEGFAAIVIDRYGYEGDAAAIEHALRTSLPADGVIARNARYTALDIRSLASDAANLPPLSKATAMTLGMKACDGQPLMNLERVGTVTAPFGSEPLRVGRGEDLSVSGWAVDGVLTTSGGGLDVLVDRVPFPAVYGIDRDDVSSYFKRAEYRQSGFTAIVPSQSVGGGEHELAVRLVAADRRCYYESSGHRFVVE
jgi:hypothetical protein